MNAYTGNFLRGASGSQAATMEFMMRRVLSRVGTSTPVLVTAVDGSTVDVQPMVSQLDGTGNFTPHAVVAGLPWTTIQGGDYALLISPQVGDRGIAIFASEDISTVKNTRALAGPASRRRFSMSDGMYIGGLLNDAPTNFVKIAPDGIAIKFGSQTLLLNGSGLFHNGVPIGATHTHTEVQTGSGVSGPPSAL